MKCEECGNDIPFKDLEDDRSPYPHYFCGYGYGFQYCSMCCPVDFDGQHCECHERKTKVKAK